MAFQTKAKIASFGGTLLKLTHQSTATQCEMALNLYLPPQAKPDSPLFSTPVLFYLAGLTCTGDNGAEKGFFQSRASQRGIAIVYPDTSPRGLKIAGEDESYDFGSGAGFYVDATREPWSKAYHMYSYITHELPLALFREFEILDPGRMSITGHSMGGHGALICYLRNPGKYRSASAIAPISNPIECPWGQKAFQGYLGPKEDGKWEEYDATELVKKHKGPLDILIDVGTSDDFYKQKQLLPENLVEAARSRPGAEVDDKPGGVTLRMSPGDHSYYFISSHASDHVDHAAKYLV